MSTADPTQSVIASSGGSAAHVPASARAISTARFVFEPTPLAGVWLVQRRPIADARGFFARLYCAEEFGAIGLSLPPVQMNHSFSRHAGTVRGLHFQHAPHAETKIVSCPAGRIFDVAVDLRRGSPTFLQRFGAELSAENQRSLIVPPGFAHGFQTLDDDSQTLYCVTAAYCAEAEDGVQPFDAAIGVRWPLAPTEVSPRDAGRALLDRSSYAGIDWPQTIAEGLT